MNTPILSICIPTYNRRDFLEQTIKSIIESDVFKNTFDVEIVISNNCSTDDTHSLCTKYAELFPDKIKYINQETPVFSDLHIFKAIEYASGTFCKLNNDTCVFKENAVDKIVDFLRDNLEEDCICFINKKPKKNSISKFYNFDDFIKKVSYKSTWISALCIRKDVYESLTEPLKENKLQLAQVDIYGQLFEKNHSVIAWRDMFFDVCLPDIKNIGYSVSEVFGKNYFVILNKYVGKNNGITAKTIKNDKRNLINFINSFYFDVFNKYNLNKSDYFKNLKENFLYEPCFYMNFIKYTVKKLLHI